MNTINLWDVKMDSNVKLQPCAKSMTFTITKDRTLQLKTEERSGLFYPVKFEQIEFYLHTNYVTIKKEVDKMEDCKRHEINFKETIVSGDGNVDETIKEHERKGYVLIHQGPAALLHPRAVPSDTILVFALPIGERAYELYYGGEMDSPTTNLH